MIRRKFLQFASLIPLGSLTFKKTSTNLTAATNAHITASELLEKFIQGYEAVIINTEDDYCLVGLTNRTSISLNIKHGIYEITCFKESDKSWTDANILKHLRTRRWDNIEHITCKLNELWEAGTYGLLNMKFTIDDNFEYDRINNTITYISYKEAVNHKALRIEKIPRKTTFQLVKA